MIYVREITNEQLERLDDYLLFIYTPFCGTCHVARSFLSKIEATHGKDVFYKMNASFFPEIMQDYKIESVPCLLIKSNGEIKEKVYTFHSIANMYHYVYEYRPDLFKNKEDS